MICSGEGMTMDYKSANFRQHFSCGASSCYPQSPSWTVR